MNGAKVSRNVLAWSFAFLVLLATLRYWYVSLPVLIILLAISGALRHENNPEIDDTR